MMRLETKVIRKRAFRGHKKWEQEQEQQQQQEQEEREEQGSSGIAREAIEETPNKKELNENWL
jgi:hypothetical protein